MIGETEGVSGLVSHNGKELLFVDFTIAVQVKLVNHGLPAAYTESEE